MTSRLTTLFRRRAARLIVPVIVPAMMLVLGACGTTTEIEEILTGSTEVTRLGPIDYRVELTGMPAEPDLQDVVQGVLRTYTQQPRGVRSAAGLERRARGDLPELRRILRASGFYDAEAEIAVDAGAGPDSQPVATFQVVPGPRYVIGKVGAGFVRHDSHLPDDRTIAGILALPAGEPAAGASIVAAEGRLVSWLQGHGFPYAAFVDRKAVANTDSRTIDVTMQFDAGPRVTYGPVQFEGETGVEESYLRDLTSFEDGGPVDRAALDKLQSTLSATGLFEAVSVRIPPRDAVAEEGGTVPVTVHATAAPARSISGSLRFDTDRGPGVRAGWRHRNLLGRAEDFQSTLDLALDEQKAEVELARPRYPSAGWTAFEGAELRNTFDDAFDERAATVQAGLRRGLENGWNLSGAVQGSFSSTESATNADTSYLLGLPLSVRQTRTDDPLDATDGHKLFLSGTPYVGLFDGDPAWFGVLSGGGSYYLPVIGKNRLVLASRLKVSSILSTAVEDVPVNQLFFSGGGSSVRGFGYRSISPVSNGVDTGGRFLLESGIEARVRVTEDFGFVAFADTGLVEEEPFPNFKEKLNVGVGGGFRYYSPVGPIRLDLAFPLDRRAGDSLFEFYISLGQAF